MANSASRCVQKLHCQGAERPYAQPPVRSTMNGNLSVLREHCRRMGTAYLVLILSLIPTVLAYRRLKENAAARDQARFEQAVRSTEAAVVQGMENFVSALRGVRGLFDANPKVGPEQWQQFARSEEHTSELQSLRHLVCRLLLEKKK